MDLFSKKSIEYLEHRIDKFEGACCAGGASDDGSALSTLIAHYVLAPEGVFNGLDRMKNYFY
jgi:hypothetical protein